MKGLDEFSKREELYDEHRSDERFVQFNQLSQELAFDSRLVDTVLELSNNDDVDEDDNDNDVVIEEKLAEVRDVLETENDFFRDNFKLGSSCSEQLISCSDDIYRSIDGTCNNLRNSNWGAAGRVYRR